MPELFFDGSKYHYPVKQIQLNGVLVMPGTNVLESDRLAKIKAHPDFDKWVEMGCIRVGTPDGEPGLTGFQPIESPLPEPEGELDDIPDIARMHADEAIDAIELIEGTEVLQLLLETEQSGKARSTVLKAIQKQLG